MAIWEPVMASQNPVAISMWTCGHGVWHSIHITRKAQGLCGTGVCEKQTVKSCVLPCNTFLACIV
jgi:hypothetical protein